METIKDIFAGLFLLIAMIFRIFRVPIIIFVTIGIVWVIKYYVGNAYGLLFLIPVGIYGLAELGRNFRKGA